MEGYVEVAVLLSPFLYIMYIDIIHNAMHNSLTHIMYINLGILRCPCIHLRLKETFQKKPLLIYIHSLLDSIYLCYLDRFSHSNSPLTMIDLFSLSDFILLSINKGRIAIALST